MFLHAKDIWRNIHVFQRGQKPVSVRSCFVLSGNYLQLFALQSNKYERCNVVLVALQRNFKAVRDNMLFYFHLKYEICKVLGHSSKERNLGPLI